MGTLNSLYSQIFFGRKVIRISKHVYTRHRQFDIKGIDPIKSKYSKVRFAHKKQYSVSMAESETQFTRSDSLSTSRVSRGNRRELSIEER